jgi:hypothetical protein
MNIDIVDTDAVIAYARNPRRNSDAVDIVASSLKEFGWRQPIVVDEEMVVLAGHTRLQAAKKLGMGKVPVHIAKGLTNEQAKAYRLADNRVNEYAEWDMPLLGSELRELDDLNFDLDLTGFNNLELANLLIDPELIEHNSGEWDGMPEYEQENVAYRTIVVHFMNQDGVDKFTKLIGQTLTPKTKTVWFPPVERAKVHGVREYQ